MNLRLSLLSLVVVLFATACQPDPAQTDATPAAPVLVSRMVNIKHGKPSGTFAQIPVQLPPPTETPTPTQTATPIQSPTATQTPTRAMVFVTPDCPANDLGCLVKYNLSPQKQVAINTPVSSVPTFALTTRPSTPVPPPPPPPSICVNGKIIPAGSWMYVLSNGSFVQSSTYKFTGNITMTGRKQGGYCEASNQRWYKP